ncbi:hypothetical protein CAEBREN_04288 [Caenorhabditis brenneri]|uniref:F-box domain-containing protein n=1 Tax=Caenorhabditis brenneri TaxID=135651 RepID=G0NFH7_CAEBE|nr:hypothetical protein CAEBREN_04288 [Caenorhabditis brenneri]
MIDLVFTKMDRVFLYMDRRRCTFLHKLDKLGIRQTVKFEFPFDSLPIVVKSEVVKMMNIPDRIKLAITSQRMENLVKRASIKQPLFYAIRVDKHYPIITMDVRGDENAAIADSSRQFDRSNMIGTLELVPWLNRKYSDMQNMTHIFKKLRRILPIKRLALILIADQLTEKSVKELLSIPELTTIEFVWIEGDEIESNILKLIMDWLDTKKDISIIDCHIPEDFHHAKAFKFSSVHYEDADWVEIEDLLTLEDCDAVVLGRNYLSSEDVNRFLKFWIESDLDMFEWFSMSAETLEMTEVLEDLILVKTSRDGQDYSIVKASRKRKIMSITLEEEDEDCLRLCVYSPEESFTKEHKVLELMEQKKKLETELQAMVKNGVEARRLTMEIRKLSKELDSVCTFYNEKTAIIAH